MALETAAEPDILAKICADTRAQTERRKQRTGLTEIRQRAREAEPPRGFGRALMDATAAGRPGLITEIKKASPSGGVIRDDFDPAALARAYEAGGAVCLSVLTDEPYFHGSSRHLRAAHGAVPLPVLRKDFILDPWQVYESRALGADCILLIMAALGDEEARDLEDLARDIGLDVLAEVHDEAELDRALGLRTPLLGINNRDLKNPGHRPRHHRAAGPAGDAGPLPGLGVRHPDPRRHRGAAQGLRAGLFGRGIAAARAGCDGGGAPAAGHRMSGLTHLDQAGAARMVDVSAKPESVREATAKGRVTMLPATLALIGAGQAAKGDVLAAARLAGIMAAKRTAELIPLCHPLPLSSVTVRLDLGEAAVEIAATVRTTGRTGVEMEALTAVSVAALTIYDMVKAVDRGMTIEAVRVTAKSGGKSGDFSQP